MPPKKKTTTATPTSNANLGQWLRRLRENAGLTQDEAALAAGVSEGRSIRRWENGDAPGGLVLMRLLDAYGVEIVGSPDTPRAINSELAEVRAELEQMRNTLAHAASATSLPLLVEVLSTVVAFVTAGKGALSPAQRRMVQQIAAQERELAELLLEQADALDERLALARAS